MKKYIIFCLLFFSLITGGFIVTYSNDKINCKFNENNTTRRTTNIGILQHSLKKDIQITTVMELVGRLEENEDLNKIVLKATKESDVYYTNIFLEIYDFKTNKLLYTIKPTTNYGYEPNINLFNFKNSIKSNGEISSNFNDQAKQIFYSANSGGSGAFGFYYVYQISDGKVNTLFDYENFNIENKLTAEYVENYKLKITATNPEDTFLIDISNRGKDYLSQIYKKNGKVKQATFGDVSMINTVFPYFNASYQRFELNILRRITGLYSADAFGYYINQAALDTNQFKIFFTMVGIN